MTKEELTIGNMHCHHKIPLSQGGTDEYANLVLVTEDVHKLIHAETKETIEKLIRIVKPDAKMRNKIDTLRKKCKTNKITWENHTF